MSAPEHFEVIAGIAVYRPRGKVTMDEVTVLVTSALVTCRNDGISRILIDATRLEMNNPSVSERFFFFEKLFIYTPGIAIAMLVHPELIDKDRIGLTICRNRGILANVFSSQRDALIWLRDPQ